MNKSFFKAIATGILVLWSGIIGSVSTFIQTFHPKNLHSQRFIQIPNIDEKQRIEKSVIRWPDTDPDSDSQYSHRAYSSGSSVVAIANGTYIGVRNSQSNIQIVAEFESDQLIPNNQFIKSNSVILPYNPKDNKKG